MLGRSPLKTLFSQKPDGGFELKPASSSPPDAETRILVPDYGGDFDPNKEALPNPETTDEILRDIRRILLDSQPNPPADNYRPMMIGPLPVGAGSQTVAVIGGWSYVYVPPVPRAVTIYWQSLTWPLAVLATGQAAKLHIPFRMDEFSLSWGTGAANDVVYLLFTTDPIDIDILAY